jgi:hypothetical protein
MAIHQPMRGRTSSLAWLAFAAALPVGITLAPALGMSRSPQGPGPGGHTLAPSSLPPSSLEIDETRRLWNKRFAEAARELRRLRAQHFRHQQDAQVRKAGVERLATFTDAPALAAMLEVLRLERDDARQGVIDHLAKLATPASIATLTYAAVHERDPAFRAMATRKLEALTKAGFPPSAFDTEPTTPQPDPSPSQPTLATPAQTLSAIGPRVPQRLTTTLVTALQGSDRLAAGNAARVVQSLGLIQAIPQLIMAQALGPTGGGGSGGDGGAIAWIAIGTQRAFIADITPVVGEGAVGFDPTPGVISDGVVLAINDAAVTTSVVEPVPEVHAALVGMSSNLTGEDTSGLKYDRKAWAQWYHHKFLPLMAERAADQREAAERAAAQARAKAQAKASKPANTPAPAAKPER